MSDRFIARDRGLRSQAGRRLPLLARRARGALLSAVLLFASCPAFADAGDGGAHGALFAYAIVGGVAFATLIGLATIRSALMGSPWSLSDALSEEAEISPLDKDGRPIPGGDGKPQVVSELRASSSRFIALLGLTGILMMYLGFGLVILAGFASTGAIADDATIKNIIYFLVSGVTMFAPYIVNKFASTFDWLAPKKS